MSMTKADGGGGDEGGVELVDIRVLPTDETDAGGTVNEVFDAQEEPEDSPTANSPEKPTTDSSSPPQVN